MLASKTYLPTSGKKLGLVLCSSCKNQICEAHNAHLSHSGWLTNPKARKQRQLVTQGWSRPRSTHLGRIAMSVTLDQECYHCCQGYDTRVISVASVTWVGSIISVTCGACVA